MRTFFENEAAYEAFETRSGSRLLAAGASENFVVVAAKIWARQPVSPDELRDLGEEIDRVYTIATSSGGGRERDQPLLAIAAEQQNLAAWEALLAAGARPDVSPVVPYDMVAARQIVDGEIDWSFSAALTRAFLAHGGDPNLRVNGSEPPLENALANGNLASALILLDAGADPWAEIDDDFSSERGGLNRFLAIRHTDYFGSGPAFLAAMAARGHLQAAPEGAVTFIVDRYAASIEEDLPLRSSDALRSLASLSEVLRAFVDAGVTYRNDDLRALIARVDAKLTGAGADGN